MYGRLDRATRAELRQIWTTVRPPTPGTPRPQPADELRAALRAVVRERSLNELRARHVAVTLPTEDMSWRQHYAVTDLVMLAIVALQLEVCGYLIPDAGDRVRLHQAWLRSDLADIDPGPHPGLADLMEVATEIHLTCERDVAHHRRALLWEQQHRHLERRLAEEEDALRHLDAGREADALLHPYWS